MAEPAKQGVIYRGNSIISIEKVAEYPHPVVIKKPFKRHPSRRSLRSLENEYEMTRSLNAIAGVRKALGQQSIEGQPALILEYIDGETLPHISPEQTGRINRAVDERLDLYSLGVVFYELKTGQLPFDSKNARGFASMEERARLIIGRGKCHARN
jgi:serine/threonine protein kinase